MSSSDVPEKNENPEKHSRSLWQRLVLAFFTLFGGITFFALIFWAIYLHFLVSPIVYKTPVADGKRLYEEMQQIEKDKAFDEVKLAEVNRMRKFVKASRGRLGSYQGYDNRK